MTFVKKYIKYKNKYLKLKYEQSGGDQKYNISFNIDSKSEPLLNINDMSFFNKYIKYKQKYLILKSEQFGGSGSHGAKLILEARKEDLDLTVKGNTIVLNARKLSPKELITSLEFKIMSFIGSGGTFKNKEKLSVLLIEITKLIQQNKDIIENEYNELMSKGKFNLDITMNNFYEIFKKYYNNSTTEDSLLTKIYKKCTDNCINCNALLVQCMWGDIETVEWLLNKNEGHSGCTVPTCFSKNAANKDFENTAKESPLIAAILSKTSDKLEKIKLLVKKGVEVDSHNINLASDKLLYSNHDDKKEDTIQLLLDIRDKR